LQREVSDYRGRAVSVTLIPVPDIYGSLPPVHCGAYRASFEDDPDGLWLANLMRSCRIPRKVDWFADDSVRRRRGALR
jgi:hypothetical protein